MKITVLTDNTVYQRENLLGEHGLSLYIEVDGKKILFDTGYSDIFIKNAAKLRIDLTQIDILILSHGHYDHTWGLHHLVNLFFEHGKRDNKKVKPVLITHPQTLMSKTKYPIEEFGVTFDKKALANLFKLKLTKDPLWITENFAFLGEIPRNNDFEAKHPIGEVWTGTTYEKDYITEDSALVYKTSEGIVVVTGCSHSGICNIVDYARDLCDTHMILDVIGGFHLFKEEKEQVSQTVEFFRHSNVKALHPCHCTDFSSRCALSEVVNVKETGVGHVLDYA